MAPSQQAWSYQLSTDAITALQVTDYTMERQTAGAGPDNEAVPSAGGWMAYVCKCQTVHCTLKFENSNLIQNP